MKREFTAADFYAADINITELARVYHTSTTIWSRPTRFPCPYDGLLFFNKGSIEYYFEDFSFTALEGQIVRLPGGRPYSGRSLDGGMLEFYCIDFTCASEDEYDSFPLPYSFTPSDPDSIIDEFAKIEQSWQITGLCSKLECKSELARLLARIAKDYAVNFCRCGDDNRIMRVREFLLENCHRSELRISEVASKFHMSEAHLRRIFGSELSISPGEYLTNLRIDRAKQLLLTKRELSVKQIADACGYSSIYYFSSAFCERVGCSPSDYREKR